MELSLNLGYFLGWLKLRLKAGIPKASKGSFFVSKSSSRTLAIEKLISTQKIINKREIFI